LNNFNNGTSKNVIRILAAEDHWIARIGIITALKMQRDMIIVGEAANGRQAVELFRKHVPDVAVLDVRMPVLSGIDAAITIRHDFPRARLIALSTYGGDEDIRRALQAGMRAYLTKDVLHDELVTAIRAVYDGGSYLPPRIAAALAAQMPGPDLSGREMEVLELVVQGLLNKQIAHTLNISQHTVKNHVKNILEKLGVEDRTQAATVSIQRGIIHL
jgi:two-component system NarL family response regulator